MEKQRQIRLGSRLCIALLAAFCIFLYSGKAVFAAQEGKAYCREAMGSYTHPDTGEIEDSGNNPGIGQGMAESIIGSEALIEKKDNSIYATIRLSMMDNISNVKFSVQKTGKSKWSQVESEVMQENINGEDCSDFRFSLPSEDVIIRIQIYVDAMGRDVVFYVSFGEKIKGTGDFIVSVNQDEENAELDKKQEKSAYDDAEELINNAEGLVLSDEKLLTEKTEGKSEEEQKAETEDKEKEEAETENQELKESIQAEEKNEESEGAVIGNDSIPALSWALVLQCILIITVPAVIASLILIAGLTFFSKQQKKE